MEKPKAYYLYLVQAITEKRDTIVVSMISAENAEQAIEVLTNYNAFKFLEIDVNKFWISAYVVPSIIPVVHDRPFIYTFVVN